VKGFGQAGSGTPRERETVANDPNRTGAIREQNTRGVGRAHGTHKAEKPQGRRIAIAGRSSGLWRNLAKIARIETSKRDGLKAGCLR